MASRTLLDFRRSWRPGHTPALVVIPLALIVVVCVIDILAPPHIHLGPLLVAAPTITVAFAGARLTALIAALAVLAQAVIGLARGVFFTANIQAQLAALVIVSILLVAFCLVRDRRERELHQVRSVAEAAQQVLLQPLPRRSGPLRIAGRYLPAEEEAQLGGDLYAAARTTASTRLLIGDVRGKGLDAISHSALLLGAFRAAAHRQATLPNLAIHLDGAVRWDTAQWGTDGLELESADTDETFVTATLLDVPDGEAVVHFIACGHPPPLLLRGRGVIPLISRESNLPLGLGGLAGVPGYVVETFPFEDGDLLLLYTDGVAEARDARGTFYPIADRVARWSDQEPEDLLRHLLADLLAHVSGRLGDDAAVVAIRRRPA